MPAAKQTMRALLVACVVGPLLCMASTPSHAAEPKLRGDVQLKEGGLPAIAFDIDGVFKQASISCAEGQEAIRKVIASGIKYVFMTNGGGGKTEAKYAVSMSDMFSTKTATNCFAGNPPPTPPIDEIKVDPQRMVLSYSPYRTRLAHLKHKTVVIIGNLQSMEVVRSYGFTNAIHISEYARRHPDMDVYGDAGSKEGPDYCGNVYGVNCNWDDATKQCRVEHEEQPFEDVEAILNFGDANHMFQFLQIGSDLLMNANLNSDDELSATQVPIYFSCDDMFFKAKFKNKRFGGGAYTLALKTLYKERLKHAGLSDKAVQERMQHSWIYYGKPYTSQYEFVEELMVELKANAPKDEGISRYYMVGDNPASDMEGARLMNEEAKKSHGTPWTGVLVRTGVYKDGDDKQGASHVANDVNKAVDWILAQHNLA